MTEGSVIALESPGHLPVRVLVHTLLKDVMETVDCSQTIHGVQNYFRTARLPLPRLNFYIVFLSSQKIPSERVATFKKKYLLIYNKICRSVMEAECLAKGHIGTGGRWNPTHYHTTHFQIAIQ